MSADLQMSSTADQVEFPYRAMSSTAIASLVFAVMAALMGFFFWPGLGMAVIGVSVGVMALSKINAYPDEFDGRNIAVAGILLNLAVLLGGASMHAYVYLTEVPEGYSRVQFYESAAT